MESIKEKFNEIKGQIKEWKIPAVIFGGMSLIFFFAFFYAAFNNHYPADFVRAVPGNSNFPVDSYDVRISPALAFSYTWGLWRVLGIIFWIATGAFILLQANDVFGRAEGSIGDKAVTKKVTPGTVVSNNPNWVVLIGMTLAIVCCFAATSNLGAGNYVKNVPATKYVLIKDNKDSLKALFPKKEVY